MLQLNPFDQCGGTKGVCEHFGECANATFTGACCPVSQYCRSVPSFEAAAAPICCSGSRFRVAQLAMWRRYDEEFGAEYFWQCHDLPSPPYKYAPRKSIHIGNYQQCGMSPSSSQHAGCAIIVCLAVPRITPRGLPAGWTYIWTRRWHLQQRWTEAAALWPVAGHLLLRCLCLHCRQQGLFPM